MIIFAYVVCCYVTHSFANLFGELEQLSWAEIRTFADGGGRWAIVSRLGQECQ